MKKNLISPSPAFNVFQNLTSKFIIYCFFILFIYSPLIYNQTLSAEKIFEKVSDAVVVIHAYNYNNELTKQGSGVVINDKGYIITNYHVLEGCERLEVLHNNQTIPYLDIIGIDVEKDILILKIDNNNFPSLKISDQKSLKIGQRVYTIGSPLGFENSISEGIISGLRNYEQIKRNFIQITASISPGSSGGAVLNDKGELIGISTLTVSEGQNLNFAIPIDDVFAVQISSYSNDHSFKDFELFYKGYDAYENGNYFDALTYYSSYLKKYPNVAVAYYNRGIAKYYLEDYRGAIQDFSKAIELDPNYAAAYDNRGITKYNLEDYRGAIQDFSKSIDLDPNYAAAYDNRGIAKYNLEDYRGAIQYYNKAIEIDSNYIATYINRGVAKDALRDYRGAIQDYNKAIEIDPTYLLAYYNRGVAKAGLKDYIDAIQDFNKAIAIDPNFALTYYKRGIAKYLLSDKSGACLDWSKAGELGDYDAYDLIRDYCN